jgi:phospholipase C
VPGLLISPWRGTGTSTTRRSAFDAYLKFIEDDFLNGQRIDPKTDGRPDPRTVVRENARALGNLASEFDFSQHPGKPKLLPLHPPYS